MYQFKKITKKSKALQNICSAYFLCPKWATRKEKRMYISFLSDCEVVSKIALTKSKKGSDMCRFKVRCAGSGFFTLNAYDEEAVKLVNMATKSKEKIL